MKKKKGLGALMLPLWLKYPFYKRYGEGWTFGKGYEYKVNWLRWLEGLTAEEFEKYKKMFPPPFQWRNYWREEVAEDGAYLFIRNHYWTEYWEKNGVPKYLQVEVSPIKGKKKKDQPFILATDSDANEGENFLSEADIEFQINNEFYFSVDQYILAEKARLFGDFSSERKIMKAKTVGELQEFDKQICFYEKEVWDQIQFTILLNGTYQKFMQNPGLREALLATGNQVLLEEKWENKILDKMIIEVEENRLGCLLMEVRDEIRRVCINEKRAGKSDDNQQLELAQLVGF